MSTDLELRKSSVRKSILTHTDSAMNKLQALILTSNGAGTACSLTWAVQGPQLSVGEHTCINSKLVVNLNLSYL